MSTLIPPCNHPATLDGVCQSCGRCFHSVLINGTCRQCGVQPPLSKLLLQPELPGSEETILALRKALEEKTKDANRWFEAKRVTAGEHANIRKRNQDARAVLEDHKRPALERISSALRILENGKPE